MKAMSPVRSVRSCLEAVCCLSEQSLGISRPGSGSGSGSGSGVGPGKSPRSAPAEEAAASLLYDMKGCYSKLAELVPGIPQGSQPSQVEILQHVIDYICDLQVVLEEQAKHKHKRKRAGRASSSSSSSKDLRQETPNCQAAELASDLCSKDERTPCH